MSNLVNSGEDVISSSIVSDGANFCIQYNDEDLANVYCIQRCMNWIIVNKFSEVCLQFPQDCAKDAPLVQLLIQEKLPEVQLSIIFNSRAAKCCVSLKNAAYRKAEAIVQYGRTCLTPVTKLPVLHIPAPFWATDVGVVAKSVLQTVQQDGVSSSSKYVVLFYDSRCASDMGAVEKLVRPDISRLCVSKLLMSFTVSDQIKEESDKLDNSERFVEETLIGSVESDVDNSSFKGGRTCDCSSDYSEGVCRMCYRYINRKYSKKMSDVISDDGDVSENSEAVVVNGRLIFLPVGIKREEIVFIFIGRDGPTLNSISLKLAQYSFHIIDPITGEVSTPTASKIIMRRNYKIEQLKDADTIGVVISNFNLPRYKEIMGRLMYLISSSGKKVRALYTSEPDLPKLSNSLEVSVFVYIACPESSVVGRQEEPELYKLLVTPWELEVALNPDKEWSLDFETDFTHILPATPNPNPSISPYAPQNSTSTKPEHTVSVSLLTNKTQSLGITPDVETASVVLDSRTGALVETGDRQTVLKQEAGRKLGLLDGETPWYGLDPSIAPVSNIGAVVQGRKGVAGGYVQEGT